MSRIYGMTLPMCPDEIVHELDREVFATSILVGPRKTVVIPLTFRPSCRQLNTQRPPVSQPVHTAPNRLASIPH